MYPINLHCMDDIAEYVLIKMRYTEQYEKRQLLLNIDDTNGNGSVVKSRVLRGETR